MTVPPTSPAERAENRHLLAWLLFPLSLFPLVALLTYDWHSIPALNVPSSPSSNWIGALGDCFAYYGYSIFGLAIWIIPALCVIAGICLIVGRRMRPGRRSFWFLVLLSAVACLMQVFGAHVGWVAAMGERVNLADTGGAVGYLLMTRALAPLLSDFGSSIVMTAIAIFALVAAIGARNIANAVVAVYRWATVGAYMKKMSADAAESAGVPDANGETAAAPDPQQEAYLAALRAKAEANRQREEEKAAAKAAKQAEKEARQAEKEAAKAAKAAEREAARRPAAPPPTPAPAPAPANGSEEDAAETVDKGPYILPQLSLLNPLQKTEADHGDVNAMAQKLIDTLKLFNIDATLAYTIQGPVVTKYALTLAPGTRYSAVTNIEANLKGAMCAKSLRIEAPIPGEDHVGIEVPNTKPIGISFREIIESDTWKGFKGELPLLFGKDAAGRDLVADLASMPHMLVAGATGQGKSVCLNSIINGLLMTKTPEQLKFIMVDPKSVEFTSYAAIPHLLVPVITDNNKVVFSLNWAVIEMEKRLKMFARAKVRNIYDFNHRLQFTQTDMFGNDTEVGSDMPKTVPYIVIIIDEVADLMATAAKQVVPNISRLTAKARAAGIHLILATQRPDAKVITGTIKANIPGRVAFKTATGIDSRTILDDAGAENLIGRGDMLFKSKEGLLIRAQGAWISDPEIARITNFIEQHSNTQFDEKFAAKMGKIKEQSLEDDEEEEEQTPEEAAAAKAQIKADENASDFKKAVECIIETHRASTSHFQRRLGWGYNHSAKIMDQLEDAGIIGPQQGAGPRPIIMDQDQLVAVLNGNGGDASAAPAEQPEESDVSEPTTIDTEEETTTEEQQ